MIRALRRQHGRWALAIALGAVVILVASVLLRSPVPVEPKVEALIRDGAGR